MSFLKSIHFEIYIGLIAIIAGIVFFGIWMNEVFSNGSIKTWIPIAASTLLFIGTIFLFVGGRKGKKNKLVVGLP